MSNVQNMKGRAQFQFEAQINKVGSKCESRTMKQAIRCNSDSWFKETNQTKPTEKMQIYVGFSYVYKHRLTVVLIGANFNFFECQFLSNILH